MRCVGAAVSVADGLQLALQTQPDCVLLDADLAGEDGMALIPLLLERISCTVVVISSHADDSLGAYAIRLGAVAFIHKLAPAAELLNALATIPPKRLPITSLELH